MKVDPKVEIGQYAVQPVGKAVMIGGSGERPHFFEPLVGCGEAYRRLAVKIGKKAALGDSGGAAERI